MLEVLGLILPLFAIIFFGFFAGRIGNRPFEALGWLNVFVVYFALPAMFFTLLSKTPIEQLANWTFAITALVITFIIFLLTFALGIFQSGGNISESTVQGLAGAYGNIGYMGPPIALLALGPEAAVPVAIIFCFENILHFALAPALMAADSPEQKSPLKVALEILQKVCFHPLILATMIGIAAAAVQFQPPEPIERMIGYLAAAAAPCALFSLGVTLALRPLKRFPMELNYIVPMKLIIHPALMYVGLSWVGDFEPVWMYSAVLLASLPIATNVYVIAQQYEFWMERASASILVSTTASVITVSALLYLITTGTLPPDLFP